MLPFPPAFSTSTVSSTSNEITRRQLARIECMVYNNGQQGKLVEYIFKYFKAS